MKLIEIQRQYFRYRGNIYYCYKAETDSVLNVRIVHAKDPKNGNELDICGDDISQISPIPEGELGAPYYPASDELPSIETSVPDSMADDITKAMQRLKKAVGGSTVDFVCERLQWTKEQIGEYLFAEQVDAVALAIYNIEARNQAIIIGDQTGIGKGRMAASLIRYAYVHGKKAVFITEKPKLFTDIYRDLSDTGSGNLKPFILASNRKDDKGRVEAAIYETDSDGNILRTIYAPLSLETQHAICSINEFPDGYDFICTTYSQFSATSDPEKVNKATYKGYVRNQYLKAIAPECIMILDEAHNASGSSEVTDRRTGENTGEIKGSNTFQVISTAVKIAQGVCFLSATFAKTPNNMPLYTFRSCLSETGLADGELIASIKKGGEALQEVISSSLVHEGQMVRREKTYDGIDVRYIYLNNDGADKYGVPDLEKIHCALSDNVTDLMRKIIEFERKYINPIIGEIALSLIFQGETVSQDNAKLGINRVEYFSRAHNIVRQMMLSVKAEAIADHAIRQLKEGKKVVIALSQTFEAMLTDLMEELHVPADSGKYIRCDFGMALVRGLKNTLNYSVKDEKGHSAGKMSIPVSMLPPESQAAYYELEAEIKRTKTGVNVSPIDIIEHKIRKAGYRLAEITGRHYTVQFTDDTFTNGTIHTRAKESANAVVTQFQNNRCDVLIINSSGATGLSVQATYKGTNLRPEEVKPRCMIIAECELDISKEVQKRGRINRTGQMKNILPSYDYVMSAIPAERRNMMMLQKKLLSLDANTTSKQKQSTKIIDVTDLLNKYGDTVVVQYLKDNAELNGFLGDPLHLYDEDKNAMKETETVTDAVKRVSGRVALLKCNEQEDFYNTVTESYTTYVNYLKQRGEYDLEVADVPLNATLIKKSVFTAQKSKGNSVFAAASYICDYECDNLIKPYTATQVEGMLHNITQSYGDATPQQYAEQLVQEFEKEALKAKKLRELDCNTQYQLQIATIDKSKSEPDKKAEKREELDKKHSAQLFKIEADCNHKLSRKGVIRQFYAGKFCNTDYGYAICLGAKIGKAKNPYILSNISISFAVASSAKLLEFNLSDNGFTELGKISAYGTPELNVLEDWNRLVAESSKSREERQIITGNILAAYPQIISDEKYANAKFNVRLITFTLSNGGREKGILLPKDVHGTGTTVMSKVNIDDAQSFYSNDFSSGSQNTTIQFTSGIKLEVNVTNGTIDVLTFSTPGQTKFYSEIANDGFWVKIDPNGRGCKKRGRGYEFTLHNYYGLKPAFDDILKFLASKQIQIEVSPQDAEKIFGKRSLNDNANWKPLAVNPANIPQSPTNIHKSLSPLLLAEAQLAKLKGGLKGLGGLSASEYQNILAQNEDWYRCIVNDSFFVQKPLHVRQKKENGFIQSTFIGSKTEEEKWIENTDKIFNQIIAAFPEWETPDPIIRYAHKKYSGDKSKYAAQRQLRFTPKETEKFLKAVPYFLALINADESKFSYLKDENGLFWAYRHKDFCKFLPTETAVSKPTQAPKKGFTYDYNTEIDKFIKYLQPKKAGLKSALEKFYKRNFYFEGDNCEWIATHSAGICFVEDYLTGGMDSDLYNQLNVRGNYYNTLGYLASIFYQRICAEHNTQPQSDWREAQNYPFITVPPMLYSEAKLAAQYGLKGLDGDADSKVSEFMLDSSAYDNKHINNLAPDKNIPYSVIENLNKEGMTLESIDRLTASGFPVCKYKTQVTVHGICPELKHEYIGGYKCLTVNQNQSLGIRWIGIDSDKKKRIGTIANKIAYVREKDENTAASYHYFKDSTVTSLRLVICKVSYKGMIPYVPDKAKEIAQNFIKTVNDSTKGLFFGYAHTIITKETFFKPSLYCVDVVMLGIYEKNIEAFIRKVYGLSESEYKAKLARYDELEAEYKEQRRQEEEESKRQEAEKEKSLQESLPKFKEEYDKYCALFAQQHPIPDGFIKCNPQDKPKSGDIICFHIYPSQRSFIKDDKYVFDSSVFEREAELVFKTFYSSFGKMCYRRCDENGVVDKTDYRSGGREYSGGFQPYWYVKAKSAKTAAKSTTKTTTAPTDFNGSLQIVDYSDKAIVLTGDTKPLKDEIKALGGKFGSRFDTSKVPSGIGWLFPKSKLQAVQGFVSKYSGVAKTAVSKLLLNEAKLAAL